MNISGLYALFNRLVCHQLAKCATSSAAVCCDNELELIELYVNLDLFQIL